MLKVYTTGPILNTNEATGAGAVLATFSDKFKIAFDPLFNQRYNANCCPCYVVATLYSSDGASLVKTLVETKSAILSDKNYSSIELPTIQPLPAPTALAPNMFYEIEVKIFCPGNTPIFNIFGLKNTGVSPIISYSLVPCHCFKFKDLVAIDTDCCCEDDVRSDSSEEPISDSCDKHYRPRHNRC